MLLRKLRHAVYLIASLGMLVYAIPRLEFGGAWDMADVFGVVWCVFALLVIAANLNEILLVDEQKRKQLERIKRAKYAAIERRAARGARG
ncbi:hypothetical protein ACFSL6_26350 [Paenibacillus thailandensis]|uniref:Uncharacterized protein n=1 Tax=Paenibacillus thailandensis TaxID=393250 RepID=A0ABW5QS49_9BACL